MCRSSIILLITLVAIIFAENRQDSIIVIKPMNLKVMNDFARIYNLPVNMKQRHYPDFLEFGAYEKLDRGSLSGSGYRLIYKTYKPANKDSSKYIPDKKYDLGYDPGTWPHLFYKADINNDGYMEFIHLSYIRCNNSKYDAFDIYQIFSLRQNNQLAELDFRDSLCRLHSNERKMYSLTPAKPFIYIKNSKIYFQILNPYISFEDYGTTSSEHLEHIYKKYAKEVFDEYYTLLWENDSIKVVDYKKVVHKKIKPPKRPKYKEPNYEYDLKITGTDSIESLKIIKVPVKKNKK